MDDKKKGILFSILSGSLAISPVLFSLSMNSINPETTNLLQTFFASILFVVLFFSLRKTTYFKTIIKNWKMPAVIGFFVFLGGLLYTYGIFYSGPTTASFIIQFTSIFTVLFGLIFLKERFTKLEGLGVVLAIIGLLIMSYSNVKIENLSVLILLVGALFFALSNLFSKIYVKNVNPIALAGGRTMFIFLFFLIFSLLTGKLQTNIPTAILGYGFLAGITGAFLNFILSFKALELIEVSKVSLITSSIGPFSTMIYSFIILSSIPTLNQLLGGTLIVLGIATLILAKGK